MIYLLTAFGLSPGGSSTVHIYTRTIHLTTQNKQYIEQHNNLGKCGPSPVLARFTLAFALQLRKKHGKNSVMVAASKVRVAASKYIDNYHNQFYRNTYNDKTPSTPETIHLFFQKELRS